MGKPFGYKKYMKKDVKKSNSLLKTFIISFLACFLVCTFIFKSFPSVDTSIGEYQQSNDVELMEETKKVVDESLSAIQNEDQGKTFTDIISQKEDKTNINSSDVQQSVEQAPATTVSLNDPQGEVLYKVFVGTYTSSEQAKVAKDIIQESGNGLNPIVKCLGANNYTLQVGIFKNKQSAESLLYTIQQSHLPGRIVQDY